MSEPRTFKIPPELAQQFDNMMGKEIGLKAAMSALTAEFTELGRTSKSLWEQVRQLHPDMGDTPRYHYDAVKKVITEKP